LVNAPWGLSRDEQGTVIGQASFVLGPHAHVSFGVQDRFPITRGRQGWIEFQSSAGSTLAGLGLRFNPNSGNFSGIPLGSK
jgi:hypothetical protein